MRAAIIGAGGIGSALATLLARAGHDVTLVARGARLVELQRDGLRVRGSAAPKVTVAAELPVDEAFELVLVTALATQVDVLLPALARSKARTVMFMFNTFGGLERLRDAVGSERFAFGFPAIVAQVKQGELVAKVVPRLFSFFQITTLGGAQAAELARTFSQAGIPSVVHDDIDAWLQSHAAFMAPLMLTGAHGRPLTWAQARAVAELMKRGFALARRLTPLSMRLTSWQPALLVAALLWVLSRTPVVNALGARGPGEARALLAAMKLPDPLRDGAGD